MRDCWKRFIIRPADVRRLPGRSCRAVRRRSASCWSRWFRRNGGHLSSNLGAVELTLALHRVFDSPRDKHHLGHRPPVLHPQDHHRSPGADLLHPQARTDCSASPTATKASTTCSIPATPRPRWDSPPAWPSPATPNEDFHIVAVIGDGALTGGVALEALNHIGQVKQRLIIVLNDNKMSISPNVGGISKPPELPGLGTALHPLQGSAPETAHSRSPGWASRCSSWPKRSKS